MSQPTLSDDEFTRLQEQLINLRTENYELASQLQKAQSELSSAQEKCAGQEKELTRVNKLMKFPGFQAITKNKRKGNYDEIVEENERLSRQMQRHEEDFNLQNKTLLEEVSRVTAEKDCMEEQLKQLTESRLGTTDESDEIRRLKAENAALQKTIRDNGNLDIRQLESPHTSSSENVESEESRTDNPISRVKALLTELKEKLGASIQEACSGREGENNKTDEEKATVNLQTIERTLVIYFDNALEHLKDIQTHGFGEASHGQTDLNMKLETEVAEKKLILDQLNEERETYKKETNQLKDERDKLQVKNAKKQTSFLQIQEEKDKLYDEKKKLEEQLTTVTSIVEKQQGELDEFARIVEELRTEKKAIEEELQTAQEKFDNGNEQGIADVKKRLDEKSEQFLEVETKLQGQLVIQKGLEAELLKMTDENKELQSAAKESRELAEKRKTLLDDLAIEKQLEVERQHDEIKRFRSELQTQRGCLDKELAAKTELTTEINRLKEKVEKDQSSLEASEKKSGWLERTLREVEETLNKEREEHTKEIERRIEEQEIVIEHLKIEFADKMKEESSNKNLLLKDLEEQKLLVGKLNQAAKDREVEFRISNKKGDHLVKDLKKQLNMEKKRADQIQQRLQDFLAEGKVKQTFDELFNNDSMQYKGHRRQDSGSHLSNISSASNTEADELDVRTNSPSRRQEPVITNETLDLINRLADLQQEKWILEEKVRHLEENGATMADDLMKKTSIIQAYVMDTRADATSEQSRKKNQTLKEKMIDSLKPGKSEETLREMNVKLQRMLEETFVKNVQLQQDVDHLASKLQENTKNDSSGS